MRKTHIAKEFGVIKRKPLPLCLKIIGQIRDVVVETGLVLPADAVDPYVDHPFLTEASAVLLRDADVACVGIDTLNIDSTEGGARPVHSVLLRAEIPIVEHLTNLDALPATGFTFTAVPPKIEGAGTFTVRAFATV